MDDTHNQWFNKAEIDSHSSMLTNRRVFFLKEETWRTGMDAISYPGTDLLESATRALNYFGAVVQQFLETHVMYGLGVNEPLRKRLDELYKQGCASRVKLLHPNNPTQEAVQDLVGVCIAMQYVMNRAQQNLRYLFRTGTTDPKGIEDSIAALSGSVWAGKKAKAVLKNGNEKRDE